MGDFEAQIDKQNKKPVKEARTAAREEKIDQTLGKIKKAVLSPFEKIKAGIESEKKDADFQSACTEQYKAYIAKAEESDDLIGTVETRTGENGEKIETVYTEHGPIIKTTTFKEGKEGREVPHIRYEGLAPILINNVEQLVYVNLERHTQRIDYDLEARYYDGIIRHPDGKFLDDNHNTDFGDKIMLDFKHPDFLEIKAHAYKSLDAAYTTACQGANTTTELPPEA